MLFALLSAVTLLQRPPTPPPQAPAAPDDTVALLQRVALAERQFLDSWARRIAVHPATFPRPGQPVDPRLFDATCREGTYTPDGMWGPPPALRRIRSAASESAVCPNWTPRAERDGMDLRDERLGIDEALPADARAAIARERAALIALLDSAAVRMPANAFIVGQRVRFLTDQGELNRALDVAKSCRAFEGWCAALRGYVLHRGGEVRDAAMAFEAAIEPLNDTERCAWTSVRALIDSAARGVYDAIACEKRLAFHRQFWWLSDPLWSDSVNDREVEHFARQVTQMLHSATAKDERYDWRPETGGDALAEMLSRYGWPTFSHRMSVGSSGYVGGGSTGGSNASIIPGRVSNPHLAKSNVKTVDALEMAWNRMRREAMTIGTDAMGDPIIIPQLDIMGSMFDRVAATPAPSHGTTFEYSIGRVHTVPVWNALADPYRARVEDWSLAAPRDGPMPPDWWPHEHYAPARPIVPFHDQQTAFLRRSSHTLFAFATNLARADLRRRERDTVNAVLMLSPGPDAIVTIAQRRAAAGGTLRFVDSVPVGRQMAGIEVLSEGPGLAAARTRFAIDPPPAFSAMASGETAISEPVLLYAPGDGALPNEPEAALARMMGTTTLPPGEQEVGVYWETYGFTPADSVDVTLHVQRQMPPGARERDGVVVNTNPTLAMSWREPDPARAAYTLDGAVVLQTRSVVLNIAALPAGEYELQVAVARRGETGVRATRRFVVQ